MGDYYPPPALMKGFICAYCSTDRVTEDEYHAHYDEKCRRDDDQSITLCQCHALRTINCAEAGDIIPDGYSDHCGHEDQICDYHRDLIDKCVGLTYTPDGGAA